MAEEHRCHPPRLCNNNCGFFGSPTTQNLCSKCFRDLQLKEQQSSSAKLVLNQTLVPPPAISQPSTPSGLIAADSSSSIAVDLSRAVVEEEKSGSVAEPKRCGNCRKRVGMTGFKCRCGLTLCGSHRYPEKHECEFDFKEMGREQIAKANPVVKGEKLRKI
ncbi:putative transcription regulator A20-like family [Lupinus albus]|uniref:Putative transcription regulator A20-like family n=1 Tax=Lupinus albus TaxID=3870 RepID=A0A6A4NHF9_LUPAL|nr:putative transcription regulator A20-like family [Lupinus albus]